MSNWKNKRIGNSEGTRIWFWSLTAVLVFSSFSYGYLVRGAIVNVVARQNIESQLSTLNTKVLNLESEYINIGNSITPEKAQSLGFVPVSSQKFVLKDASRPGLSVLTSGL